MTLLHIFSVKLTINIWSMNSIKVFQSFYSGCNYQTNKVSGNKSELLNIPSLFTLQGDPPFWPRRLCVCPLRWRLQCIAGHCYYHRSVSLLSYFFFLSVFCFWSTSGKFPKLKFCFPQYFGRTRRYMPKKNQASGQRLVTAAWATRSPLSIY